MRLVSYCVGLAFPARWRVSRSQWGIRCRLSPYEGDNEHLLRTLRASLDWSVCARTFRTKAVIIPSNFLRLNAPPAARYSTRILASSKYGHQESHRQGSRRCSPSYDLTPDMKVAPI